MEQLSKIEERLKSHSLRVTQSRLAVATILIQKNSLLTPEEIHKSIQDSKDLNCDQASVYRTLSTFEEIGLVEKTLFQGEPVRYKIKDSQDKCDDHHHVHYFKCKSCQIIIPLKGCIVDKQVRELEEEGYQGLSHHLEITGLCPKCASH